MKEQDIFLTKIFTMVEENFVLRESEISLNEGNKTSFQKKLSPWLKKILNQEDLKSPQMKEQDIILARSFAIVEVQVNFLGPPGINNN